MDDLPLGKKRLDRELNVQSLGKRRKRVRPALDQGRKPVELDARRALPRVARAKIDGVPDSAEPLLQPGPIADAKGLLRDFDRTFVLIDLSGSTDCPVQPNGHRC